MSLGALFISSILSENIILTKFLGLCPFVGSSSKESTAIRMGLSVMIVVVLSSIINYLIYYYILVPTNSEYFKTLVFILVIASLVQLSTIIIKSKFHNLYKLLGIYLPLITTNCAVFGTVLLNINNEYNLLETTVYSIGSSLGFMLILYIFSTIREKIDKSKISESFKGYPIAFITAGIMAIIFSRFTGV